MKALMRMLGLVLILTASTQAEEFMETLIMQPITDLFDAMWEGCDIPEDAT